jgi:hypothetical protein
MLTRTTKNPYAKHVDSDTAARTGDTGRTITPQSTFRSKTKTRNPRACQNVCRKRTRKSSAPPRNHLYSSLGPSSTQQFPHRAGRVHSSRFGASLRVSPMSISALGSESKERDRASNPFQDSESDGDEAGPTLNSEKSEEDHPTASICRNHPATDDDDDDDDDLFSYVAFPKEK